MKYILSKEDAKRRAVRFATDNGHDGLFCHEVNQVAFEFAKYHWRKFTIIPLLNVELIVSKLEETKDRVIYGC